ncbi:MAG: Asp-tRNA(Asn)/Glu-tRNA(Gln) amidotransferase GatCAB subunit B, partial [Deltaproteobacteria bacterium]|nr:Asp-tRNA(Asn)/Glu-tRNA(Gln) amidotransferase GatCAB subunit B [Deltaproteobacteria bacterium]
EKEESHDYRYFPDPDLTPIVIDDKWIEDIRRTLPELPTAKRDRFIREYELPENDAEILTSSRALADYFEASLKTFNQPKIVSNWIMSELMRELKADEQELENCPVKPGQLGALLKLVQDGKISGKIAKAVFSEMYQTGKDPEEIVSEKGLEVVSDKSQLESIIEGIMDDHTQQVAEYRAGKEKLLGFFVGQVMKHTKGQADPKIVNTLLKKKLS